MAHFLKFLKKIKQPNVILITIDSLRFDHLGCYGYKINTSPAMDKLSREGILFTQAIAQASWTIPSIISLATSTYPSTNRVYSWDSFLSMKFMTLGEILKNNGYHSFLCNGHDNSLFDTLRLEKGFDKWNVNNKKEMTTAGKIAGLAVNLLQENKNEKLFLWLHYIDTHDYNLGIPQEKHHMENVTSKEMTNYIFKYDKAISYIDSQINVLLKKLNELELYENTVIIITSDHGEEMGEHGFFLKHSSSLWDTLIRVPLIIYYHPLSPKNKIITQQVQHIDICPTICDILNIKKPKSFEGRSLLPLIRRNEFSSNYAFSEHTEYEGYLEGGRWLYTKFSIRIPHWKLIKVIHKDGEEYELYDLKNDIKEIKDLREIENEQFEFLKLELEKWINRQKPSIIPLSRVFDDEDKERLRKIGYLQ